MNNTDGLNEIQAQPGSPGDYLSPLPLFGDIPLDRAVELMTGPVGGPSTVATIGLGWGDLGERTTLDNPSAEFTLWSGSIPDYSSDVPFQAKTGAYWIPGLLLSSILRITTDPTERRKMAEWGSGLGRGDVGGHTSAFAEADEGSLDVQYRRILEVEAKTGLRFGLLVLSGDTRPESIKRAGLPKGWVEPGKSIHLYLLFDRLLQVSVTAEKALWQKIQHLLCVVFRADTAITNTDRKMRLPGIAAGRIAGDGKGHRTRIQTIIRGDFDRFDPASIPDVLTALLASEGVADPEAAFRAIQLADKVSKSDGEGAKELAARIRLRAKADDSDERAANKYLGRANPTGGNSTFPDDTRILMADGRSGTLAEVTFGLPAGGRTLSCFCPAHANSRTPAATVGLGTSGKPFLRCFGTCGCTYRTALPPDPVVVGPLVNADLDDVLEGIITQTQTEPDEDAKEDEALHNRLMAWRAYSAAMRARVEAKLDEANKYSTEVMEAAHRVVAAGRKWTQRFAAHLRRQRVTGRGRHCGGRHQALANVVNGELRVTSRDCTSITCVVRDPPSQISRS